MAASTLTLNPGVGGSVEDVESLTGAGGVPVIRQRLQVTGALLAEVARVVNSVPSGSEYALITRNIPSGTQGVNVSQVLGSAPSSTNALPTLPSDNHGHSIEFTLNRELIAAIPLRLVGASFVGATIDSNFWTSGTNGAGASVTQATNDVTIASGTTNSGYAFLVSTRKGRFIFAHPQVCQISCRISSIAVANNTRRWGAYTASGGTPQNGFYFEVAADGTLSVVRCNGGSTTSVASGSFNGSVSSYTMDVNLHIWEIHYYLNKCEFYIDNVLIHTFTATTSNLSGDFYLPVQATSVNSASGTVSGVIDVHAGTMIRIGRDMTQPRSVFQQGMTTELVLKRGTGIVHTISITGVVNNSVVTLYDNTAALGTVLWASGSMSAVGVGPVDVKLDNVEFSTGLTMAITAANCNCLIVYE